MKKNKLLVRRRSVYLLLLGLLFSSFTLQAKDTTNISINKTGVSIRTLLNEIEKTTSYQFIYNEKLVDADQIVSVNLHNQPLEHILNNIFKDTDISYTIVDNQIILAPKQNNEQQQKHIIQGTITDVEGNGLPGVSIFIKSNPSIGTITDIDGKYTLEAPQDAVLVIKYIGFTTQEIKVDNKNTIDIQMKEDAKALDEVVVVGYTTQRKADLTGAVASVKMETLNDMASTGISDALQGRMSGVTILQNSGAPGAGTAIHIRGVGTFGNKEPLYVIDGVPAENMNDVSPTDIERVDVLKDASSSAIYGSRAANGVVLIQTKRGKLNSEKINVSLNTYHGFSTPSKKMKLLNAQDRNMIHKEAYTNAFNDLKSPKPEDIANYKKTMELYSDDRLQNTETNWQDEVFKDIAYQGNYDLSVAGGSKNATYSVMLGNFTQDGILKETSFERTSIRVNTEIQLFKGFKFGENLMVSHSKQKIVPDMQASGAIISALRADPSVPVYDSEGKLSGSGLLKPDIQNPVGIIKRADRTKKRDRVFGNVYAEYNFLKDFTLKTDFGYDRSDWGDNWFSPKVPEAGRASNNNELTVYDEKDTKWMNTTTIRFNKQIKQHNLMVLGGHSYEYRNITYTDARGSGFLSEDKKSRYLGAATNIMWMLGGRNDQALDSWFGRADYSFADKYLLSASFRADGSSKFSKDNRWGYFPSISAGWRISEERFFEALKSKVQNLKLRASWGKLGNENLSFSNSPFYPTYTIYANSTDNDGYNVVFGNKEHATIGRYESTLPNPDLKWETTTQYDAGIDVTFLNDFDFGFDYYSKDSKDVLVNIPIPAMSGFKRKIVNGAKVRNRGFEFNAAYTTKLTNDLSIRAYGNIATVSNKVTSLGGGTPFSLTSYRGSSINRVEKGQPIGYLWGYKTDGIFRTQAEIDAYINKDGKKIQKDAKPGDIKFVDIDGNGSIDGNDRTKIGSGFPKVTYGFGIDLTYKGFDLNMFFQGVGGSQIFNALKYEGMFVDPQYNQYAAIKGRFHETNNPDGKLPRVTTDDKNGNRSRFSDYYVESGSYLRMKTLTLGYTFNKEITGKLKLQKLRLYATAQNLFTITPYSGFDPDLGNAYANERGNNSTEIGVDRGQFPQPRTFIFGVNINF